MAFRVHAECDKEIPALPVKDKQFTEIIPALRVGGQDHIFPGKTDSLRALRRTEYLLRLQILKL